MHFKNKARININFKIINFINGARSNVLKAMCMNILHY